MNISSGSCHNKLKIRILAIITSLVKKHLGMNVLNYCLMSHLPKHSTTECFSPLVLNCILIEFVPRICLGQS